MSQLKIEFPDDRAAFAPGDEVRGTVYWSLDAPATSAELRLFWYTRGKGTEDAAVVETLEFEQPRGEDSRMFRFKLPESPYSFSGQLISLIWSLELVLQPGKLVQRREIVVGPGRNEVRLQSLPEDRPKMRLFKRTTA